MSKYKKECFRTKILVTGGYGFIGSQFIKQQLKKNPKTCIINVDKLSYASDKNRLRSIETSPRYCFIKADTREQDKLLPVMRQVDYVVNFAAETHVDNSIKNPRPFIESNILGTFALLENAKQCRNIKKFVQVSTDEVYGPILQGGFSESAPIKPSNPYSAAKACADALVYSYFVTYQLPVVITRTTNNYGPGQFPEKAIPVFIKKALANEKLPIYGDGQHRRCWIHVEDHCAAISLVMRRGKPGEIYHIAGDVELANLNIARKILKITQKPQSLIGFIEDYDIRPGHDRRYSLDDSKIRRELGWKASIEFDGGLERTVKEYVRDFSQ